MHDRADAHLPNFLMGSLPDLTCLPSDTTDSISRAIRVPSKVLISASSIRNVFATTLNKVELSLRTSGIAAIGAMGPSTKASIATCGRYVKKNIDETTPTPTLSVGPRRDIMGCHSARWVAK